ncbi:hypothetical protein SGFS_049130 [Streptomyces graminofaciens]|uniref:Uncharacterized protein n=2 Tax=Streptomyces graminofaciens TaxID=68212 RepID=A0ABM7FC08_9ACTN|nr:hypothetical protein SGFS_049130 [Streptomyces graminofaciens]
MNEEIHKIMRDINGGMGKRVAGTAVTAALGAALLLPAVPASAAPAAGAQNAAATTAVAAKADYKYHFTYRVIRKTTPAEVSFKKMNKIMNGVFPIKGMPKTVKQGQKICLKMVKDCNPVKVTKVGKTYFTLKSLPGHLEGAGKNITFKLVKRNGYLVLDVTASGPKAVWQKHPLTEKGNRLFAKGMWGAYAVNLAKAAEYNLV